MIAGYSRDCGLFARLRIIRTIAEYSRNFTDYLRDGRYMCEHDYICWLSHKIKDFLSLHGHEETKTHHHAHTRSYVKAHLIGTSLTLIGINIKKWTSHVQLSYFYGMVWYRIVWYGTMPYLYFFMLTHHDIWYNNINTFISLDGTISYHKVGIVCLGMSVLYYCRKKWECCKFLK